MEAVSVALEGQIGTLKEEKAKLLEDIIEAERQVLLWEKKIQLEKETQAALDPTVSSWCVCMARTNEVSARCVLQDEQGGRWLCIRRLAWLRQRRWRRRFTECGFGTKVWSEHRRSW